MNINLSNLETCLDTFIHNSSVSPLLISVFHQRDAFKDSAQYGEINNLLTNDTLKIWKGFLGNPHNFKVCLRKLWIWMWLLNNSDLRPYVFHQIANSSIFNMHSLKEGEDQKEISIEPAQALDEVEPLPEDCYSRPISLTEGAFSLTTVPTAYRHN